MGVKVGLSFHRWRLALPMLLAGLILFSLLSGVSAGMNDPPSAEEGAVATVIARITTPTLAYELAGLTGARPVTVSGALYTITTRNTHYTDAISMTTRYAYERFADFGLDVAYNTYTWEGKPRRNVVAEKEGLIDPEAVYLLVAHVDDMPEAARAPGADDNGSGSVAVLTAAQLLARRHFAHTLRFVLFSGEEQGLRGSDAYAADCAARGDDIRGVINLDMIGYNTGEPVFDIYARSGNEAGALASRQLGESISDTVGVYDLDLVPQRIDIDAYPLRGGSDQWSFLKRGYPAILVIEDYEGEDFTPYYHSVSDTLSTLDLDYYADMTRASVATIAHLGHPLSTGLLSGTVRALDTGQELTATVEAATTGYRIFFTTTTGSDGVYSMMLPVGGYTVTACPVVEGYQTTVITDVHIITDAVVARSFDLEPRPRYRFYLALITRGYVGP